MKDFIDVELAIGDYVAYGYPSYSGLVIGKIIMSSFNMVVCETGGIWSTGTTKTALKYASDLIKINEKDYMAFLMKK